MSLKSRGAWIWAHVHLYVLVGDTNVRTHASTWTREGVLILTQSTLQWRAERRGGNTLRTLWAISLYWLDYSHLLAEDPVLVLMLCLHSLFSVVTPTLTSHPLASECLSNVTCYRRQVSPSLAVTSRSPLSLTSMESVNSAKPDALSFIS